MSAKYIKKYVGTVSRESRELRNNHKSGVFWLTGLSGSGKSTIAHEVEAYLFDLGFQVYVFDGDNVRHGLCSDLSFSREGRAENVRRIAEVVKLFADGGVICLCAFITPLEEDRQRVRDIIGDDYREVFVSCPVEVCEQRDVKGYYKLARQGKIKNYTGVSAPYDLPEAPGLVLNTDVEDIDVSVQKMLNFILEQTKFPETELEMVELQGAV